jgi:hypothetical protein
MCSLAAARACALQIDAVAFIHRFGLSLNCAAVDRQAFRFCCQDVAIHS